MPRDANLVFKLGHYQMVSPSALCPPLTQNTAEQWRIERQRNLESSAASTHPQPVEPHDSPLKTPPAKIQVVLDGNTISYPGPRVLEADRHQIIAYAHLEPIRKALEKCRPRIQWSAEAGYAVIRKSDYEALVKAIKGDK